MSATAEKPNNRTVREWMAAIESASIAKPRWQRGIVWKDSQVSQLFLALLSGRPVGALLTLACGKNPSPFGMVPLENAPKLTNESECEFMVLDGQQRLTAIWRVLNDLFNNAKPSRAFFMKLAMGDDGWYKAIDVVVCKTSGSTNDRKYINDPNAAWQSMLVPLSILGKPDAPDVLTPLEEWCSKAVVKPIEDYQQLTKQMTHLAHYLLGRDISHYMLPANTTFDDAIDVFIRTNESSSKIKRFDIVVAEIEKTEEEDPLKRGLREQLENVDLDRDRMKRFFGEDDELLISSVGELMLKIACLLEDKVPTESNYSDKDRKVQRSLIKHWDLIVKGINWTFEFFEREKLFDRKRLPSEVPLRVLPALFASHVMADENYPDRYHSTMVLMRKYLWRSFLSDRYISSANSRLYDDFKGLLEQLRRIKSGTSVSQKQPIPIFEEKQYSLEAVLEPLKTLDSGIGSPNARDSTAKAVLAASLRGGAQDFGSAERISSANVVGREYHHLYPRAQLREGKLPSDQINHVLNFVLISGPTNRIQGAKTPRTYLEKWISSEVSEAELKVRVESHCVPFEKLNVDRIDLSNYKKFIRSRAEMVTRVLKSLWDGKEPIAA